jgi:hypothetical protein
MVDTPTSSKGTKFDVILAAFFIDLVLFLIIFFVWICIYMKKRKYYISKTTIDDQLEIPESQSDYQLNDKNNRDSLANSGLNNSTTQRNSADSDASKDTPES